jgi:class 3 adenylate cyclase
MVTFLFRDIEGSTELLRKLGEEYMILVADHHSILRSSFKKWDGQEVDTEGDALFVSFSRRLMARSRRRMSACFIRKPL